MRNLSKRASPLCVSGVITTSGDLLKVPGCAYQGFSASSGGSVLSEHPLSGVRVMPLKLGSSEHSKQGLIRRVSNYTQTGVHGPRALKLTVSRHVRKGEESRYNFLRTGLELGLGWTVSSLSS